MTTAEVSMKPVATHSICSRSTPKVLIMCGRATLMMLESSTAMNVPSMMMPSTPHRLPRGSRLSVMRDILSRRERCRGDGVDPNFNRKPRAERQMRRRSDGSPQRHPLGYCNECVGYALGRDQAEFGIG